MDDEPARPPPPHWLEILDRAAVDVAAGRGIPGTEVHRRLRQTIADMEARAPAETPSGATQRR